MQIDTTEVILPLLHQGKSLELTLSRKDVEEAVLPIIKKTIAPCKKCLRDAHLNSAELDHVILVGGMTKMPLGTCHLSLYTITKVLQLIIFFDLL